MHIYTVSRVFKKDAATWNAVIKELEDKRDFMFHGYRPLREALIKEMQSAGTGSKHLQTAFSKPEKTKSDPTIRQRSLEAFDVFIKEIRPKLASLTGSFIDPGQREPEVVWESYSLSGGFHFRAKSNSGEDIFAYAYCSAWQETQRKAFLELLAILAKARYGAKRPQVWFLDLKQGSILRPSNTFKNTQRDLRQTLEHLAKLNRTPDADQDWN